MSTFDEVNRAIIGAYIYVWKDVEEYFETWGTLDVRISKEQGRLMGSHRKRKAPAYKFRWEVKLRMPKGGHTICATDQKRSGLKDALRRALFEAGERLDNVRCRHEKARLELEERDAAISVALEQL